MNTETDRPTMTEELGNRKAPQAGGSLLTAASALTSLGGGQDQPQPEVEQPSAQPAHEELQNRHRSPPARPPSAEDDDNDEGPPSQKDHSGQSDEEVPMTFPQRVSSALSTK